MSVPAAFLSVLVIWSTTPLAVKWSTEGSGYLFGVTGRMALGTLFCLLLMLILRTPWPWHKRARMAYIMAAAGIYGAMLCVYWGARYIPSGLIAVLFGFTPLMTAVFAAIWLNERSLTTGRIVGILCALGGLVLVFLQDTLLDRAFYIGAMVVLLAVCIHALSGVWTKRYTHDLPALAVTTGGLSLSLPLYLLTWWLLDGHWPTSIPLRTQATIVYLGIVGSAIGFVLYFYMLKHAEASRVALIPLITPVLALIVGQSFNGEIVPAQVWYGTFLILGGLIVHHWGDRWLAQRATRRY